MKKARFALIHRRMLRLSDPRRETAQPRISLLDSSANDDHRSWNAATGWSRRSGVSHKDRKNPVQVITGSLLVRRNGCASESDQ